MVLALHWWEGQFYCEFRVDHDGSRLSIFNAGELIWDQPVSSASEAFDCAQDLNVRPVSSHAQEG